MQPKILSFNPGSWLYVELIGISSLFRPRSPQSPLCANERKKGKQRKLGGQKCQINWACSLLWRREFWHKAAVEKRWATVYIEESVAEMFSEWSNNMTNAPWCICKLWPEVCFFTESQHKQPGGRCLTVTACSRLLFTQLWKGIFNDLSLSFLFEEIISKPSLLYWLGLEGFPWCRFHFLPLSF